MATSSPSGRSDRHFDPFFYSFLREKGLLDVPDLKPEGLRSEEPSDSSDAYYPSIVHPWLAYVQLKKFSCWPVEPNWELFWKVNDIMVELYRTWIPPTSPVTLESVLKFLDLGKSPGRLWRRYGGDKLEVLENEESFFMILTDYIRSLAGENLTVFQSASLKSELRAKEKVFADPPSTRLFLGSDFLNLLVSHTYCLDFNVKFCEKALIMDHAVGPGKYYGHTHEIFTALRKFASVMSYDNKEWDGHVYEHEIKSNYIIRMQCMGKDHQSPKTRQILANIAYANCNSPMIMPDGTIVKNYVGIKNPSGQGNTTQDNTMTHQRRFYMFWFEKAPPEFKNMAALNWHTVRFFYSDDGIISVSSEILSWCNIVEYAHWSKRHGWILEYGPMRDAMESEFLGTTPAWFGGVIVPKLTFARCFCGLLRSAPNPVRNPLYTFERACAYRIENFFDHPFRAMIEEYIRWLVQNYHISYSQATMFLSRSDICALYGVPDHFVEPANFPEEHWVQMVKHNPSEKTQEYLSSCTACYTGRDCKGNCRS